MIKKLIAIFILFYSFQMPALADEASVKKAFVVKFPSANVTSVTRVPFKGLYEVYVEDQIVYTDDTVSYLLAGSLINATTKQNLTSARMQKLTAVNFDSLPLQSAIKVVRGNGKRKIAVFSDPDCPYCKKLEEDLQHVNNITVYTFLYPIEGLHAGATEKAKAVWCAPDRVKAWDDLMLSGIPPKTGANCETPVPGIVALGKKLRISGTPTMIFADGQRVSGAVPASQIEKILENSIGK